MVIAQVALKFVLLPISALQCWCFRSFSTLFRCLKWLKGQRVMCKVYFSDKLYVISLFWVICLAVHQRVGKWSESPLSAFSDIREGKVFCPFYTKQYANRPRHYIPFCDSLVCVPSCFHLCCTCHFCVYIWDFQGKYPGFICWFICSFLLLII